MVSPKQNSAHSTWRYSPNEYAKGVLMGDRVMLSRAITLVESKLESDRVIAEELIQLILPRTGNSIRIGITGIPGVGKSTFIESFGKYLTSEGKQIAVLAIDPSSQKTKGSILGDKTRMDQLARDPDAFIRPTAAGTTLGGVAENTREAILLCEAAGFQVIMVETVGVGQSEAQVRSMVDFFLLLMLGGAGDELQGIKKGIMEMADGVVITKADGDNLQKARQAQADFKHALHMFSPSSSGWASKVLIASAIEQTGIEDIWKMILDFHALTNGNGYFEEQRQTQNIDWLHSSIELHIKNKILQSPSLRSMMKDFESQVKQGKIAPSVASAKLIQKFFDPNFKK